MRMADVLKPQNVWEIVDFGLDNEQYAVQAFLACRAGSPLECPTASCCFRHCGADRILLLPSSRRPGSCRDLRAATATDDACSRVV